MTVAHIRPAEVETFSLDWGTMKWFVSPVTIPGAASSQGEALTALPDFSRHPAGEIVSWHRAAPDPGA